MNIKTLEHKIKKKQFILNLLLKIFSPTNFLIVTLSQDLDKLIVQRQKIIYNNYLSSNKSSTNLFYRIIA